MGHRRHWPMISRSTFACSFRSRCPAPKPIVSIVMAGRGPKSSATVLTIAAPVGVVSSRGNRKTTASGHPLQDFGRGRRGNGARGHARSRCGRAGRHRREDDAIDAEQRRPTGQPTMSAMESTRRPRGNGLCGWSVPCTLASASPMQVKIRLARSFWRRRKNVLASILFQ